MTQTTITEEPSVPDSSVVPRPSAPPPPVLERLEDFEQLERQARGAEAAPAPGPSVGQGGLAEAATRTLAALAASSDYELFLVSRVIDGSWTPLHAHGATGGLPMGLPVPIEFALCGNLLSAAGAVLVPDLREVPLRRVQEISESAGVHGYAGVDLRGGDGARIGTLCALSSRPVERAPHLASLLEAHAVALGEVMSRQVREFAAERAQDARDALADPDELTGLASRRSWIAALRREERRAAELAEPAGVVVIELGPLKTVRGVRRAVEAVERAAEGKGLVGRLGSRQLGVLCGGVGTAEVELVAERSLAGLEACGARQARAGTSVRRSPADLDEAWRRAEREALAVAAATARSSTGSRSGW